MVYIYMVVSTMLMLLFSGAATSMRETNDGFVWIVLFFLSVLVTMLRIANFISKQIYRKCSGEQKRVTVMDLMVFDSVCYVLYGILTGLGRDFSDVRGWAYLLLIGVPAFIISVGVIVHRIDKALQIRKKRKEDPFLVNP